MFFELEPNISWIYYFIKTTEMYDFKIKDKLQIVGRNGNTENYVVTGMSNKRSNLIVLKKKNGSKWIFFHPHESIIETITLILHLILEFQ